MTSLGVICARGSSKRLPRKNVRALAGAPLICWMARAAAASAIDRVIVSTEDDEIAALSESAGVPAPFRRPAELASDFASSPDIVSHALDWLKREEGKEYDTLVLLQPTSPFVRTADIDSCLTALQDKRFASAFTVRATTEPPQWMFIDGGDGAARPLLGVAVEGDQEHSQRLAKSWFPSGASYAVRVMELRRQNRIICDPARMVETPSDRCVDVDTALDWVVAEAVAAEHDFRPAPLGARARNRLGELS